MSELLARKVTADELRLEVSAQLNSERKSELRQFLTPERVASFMASLFSNWPSQVSLLEPGAGSGSLVAAFATRFLEKAPQASELRISAYEIDRVLAGYLSQHLAQIERTAAGSGKKISADLIWRDFIKEGSMQLSFFQQKYTHVLLNPPYKKIGADSDYRFLLRQCGLEVVNLYAAFLGLAVGLTKPEGEIVGIVPRSFCNGLYFRPFRKWLLSQAAIRQVHVFESRKKTFSDDAVLQENIIIKLQKGTNQGNVIISTSEGPSFDDYRERTVSANEVVNPRDGEAFFHLPVEKRSRNPSLFKCTLRELGLEISTGPVVDFRLREHFLFEPKGRYAPLLYSHHFRGGNLRWPQPHKKPNALRLNEETKKWLMPRGWYALTKRFTAKEEKRRLVAYVLNPDLLDFERYGFENHLNVIHTSKRGIDPNLARGLALFLNSTIADDSFRQFSGHTQVNATDLRWMRFPEKATLMKFGRWAVKHPSSSQDELDTFIENYGD